MIKESCGFRAEKSNKKGNNIREKYIIAAGAILLFISLALQAAARNIPRFGEWYAVTVYPVLTGVFGRFFGIFPFSVSEILLYLLVIFCLAYGFTHLREWKKNVCRTFLLVSSLFFLYTVNCGVNYYRRPFSAFLGYETGEYSMEQLQDLLNYLTVQVNRADQSLRQSSAAKEPDRRLSPGETAKAGVAAMENLGKAYPALAGSYPKPKKLLVSRILSVQQLAGIYSPFTIEANYNGEMTAYNIPHTVCHELSHLRGFMREDEANFIGFLACIGSEQPEFCYSGYLSAWIYAGNALAAEAGNDYPRYWEMLDEDVKEDLRENSLFWDRFDTKAAEAAEALNDTYLKANRQTDGVKSYGRVVDLLLAWRLNMTSAVK